MKRVINSAINNVIFIWSKVYRSALKGIRSGVQRGPMLTTQTIVYVLRDCKLLIDLD